jgi:hypothetical protein
MFTSLLIIAGSALSIPWDGPTAFCYPQTYIRNGALSNILAGFKCPSGTQRSLGFCYTPCPDTFWATGPACRKKSTVPGLMYECHSHLGCTDSRATCLSGILFKVRSCESLLAQDAAKIGPKTVTESPKPNTDSAKSETSVTKTAPQANATKSS